MADLVAPTVILVLSCLAVNSGSLLLTYAGLFEILLSLPLSMAAWSMLGQRYIGVLELLGLVLILCVGADDIFVFCDTWKESQFKGEAISGSLETRFIWTYQHASSAMLTTTATTVVMLLLNLNSPIQDLRNFGLFNAFVVRA